MTIKVLQEAQLEFLDAISHYEAERPGLGQRFKDEVDRSMVWIAAGPELQRLRPGGFRRMNLRIFPFYLPYVANGLTRRTRMSSRGKAATKGIQPRNLTAENAESAEVGSRKYGVRWQSGAATPLSESRPRSQSGVALRFTPHSKSCGCGASRAGFICIHRWWH